jgi:hypothetical protein
VQTGLWTALAQLLAASSAGFQESHAEFVQAPFRAGAHDGRGDRLDAGRRCFVGVIWRLQAYLLRWQQHNMAQ